MRDILRIGILGCARIAKPALIDAAREVSRIEVVAVASRDGERSGAFAREHGIPLAFGDYESLIASPEVDAIYNPLPNSLHAEWSIRAMEAGKPVLCEKPLASNAAEARRMADAARALGQPLVEAFHYRYHPLAIFVAETLWSGRLGRLSRIDAGFAVPGALVPRDDIRFQRSLAGGAMMDVGAYCINLLRLVAGEEPTVEAAKPTVVAPDIDGAMLARVGFPSGAAGSLECSLIAPDFRAWLTVEGERGRLDVVNPFIAHMGHSLVLEADGERIERRFDSTATYVFQARAFAAAILDVGPVLTDAADGVANMAAIDAIYGAAGLSPRG